MSDERINALLQFGGGLLVFVAALTPAIRHILIKASKEPAKGRIKRAALPLIRIFFMIVALVFYFSGNVGVAVVIVFISSSESVLRFAKNKTLLSRDEIVWDAIYPVVFFLLLMMNWLHLDLLARIPK